MTRMLMRVILFLLSMSCPGSSAQPADLKVPMAELLRYTGVENPAPEDVARLAELWTRAQQPGISGDERRLAFRDLLVLYSKLHGVDLASRPATMDGLAQFAAATVGAGGGMDLTLPVKRGAPQGEYLHVERRGNGPVPLVLISDVGVDGRKLYGSFASRNAGAYTMYIVTLPYAGAARPLPWPEKLDYTARPWLSQIERELLALIDQPRLRSRTTFDAGRGCPVISTKRAAHASIASRISSAYSCKSYTRSMPFLP